MTKLLKSLISGRGHLCELSPGSFHRAKVRKVFFDGGQGVHQEFRTDPIVQPVLDASQVIPDSVQHGFISSRSETGAQGPRSIFLSNGHIIFQISHFTWTTRVQCEWHLRPATYGKRKSHSPPRASHTSCSFMNSRLGKRQTWAYTNMNAPSSTTIHHYPSNVLGRCVCETRWRCNAVLDFWRMHAEQNRCKSLSKHSHPFTAWTSSSISTSSLFLTSTYGTWRSVCLSHRVPWLDSRRRNSLTKKQKTLLHQRCACLDKSKYIYLNWF